MKIPYRIHYSLSEKKVGSCKSFFFFNVQHITGMLVKEHLPFFYLIKKKLTQMPPSGFNDNIQEEVNKNQKQERLFMPGDFREVFKV